MKCVQVLVQVLEMVRRDDKDIRGNVKCIEVYQWEQSSIKNDLEKYHIWFVSKPMTAYLGCLPIIWRAEPSEERVAKTQKNDFINSFAKRYFQVCNLYKEIFSAFYNKHRKERNRTPKMRSYCEDIKECKLQLNCLLLWFFEWGFNQFALSEISNSNASLKEMFGETEYLSCNKLGLKLESKDLKNTAILNCKDNRIG